MSKVAEDALVTLLVQWIPAHRPADIPASVPVLAAVRDQLRTRPCIVLETSEARRTAGKDADPCDEPTHLASQVFAIAAETGWPEDKILFLPLARMAQYQHCLLRRNGVNTGWMPPTGHDRSSVTSLLASLRGQWRGCRIA